MCYSELISLGSKLGAAYIDEALAEALAKVVNERRNVAVILEQHEILHSDHIASCQRRLHLITHSTEPDNRLSQITTSLCPASYVS